MTAAAGRNSAKPYYATRVTINCKSTKRQDIMQVYNVNKQPKIRKFGPKLSVL